MSHRRRRPTRRHDRGSRASVQHARPRNVHRHAEWIRPIAVDWNALASDTTAVPLSPFMAALRSVGTDLLNAGELVPLVLDGAEDGPFRVVVAVWAGADGDEIVDRSERLEALFGMWDGRLSRRSAGRVRTVWLESEPLAKLPRCENVPNERNVTHLSGRLRQRKGGSSGSSPAS